MCETCPFHGADKQFKVEAGQMDPEDWACHEESGYGTNFYHDIQCRGHFEAQRRYPPMEFEI